MTFPFCIGGMSAKHLQKILSTLPCHSTVLCFHDCVCYVFDSCFFFPASISSFAKGKLNEILPYKLRIFFIFFPPLSMIVFPPIYFVPVRFSCNFFIFSSLIIYDCAFSLCHEHLFTIHRQYVRSTPNMVFVKHIFYCLSCHIYSILSRGSVCFFTCDDLFILHWRNVCEAFEAPFNHKEAVRKEHPSMIIV